MESFQRIGAVALSLSALLFALYGFAHPVTSLDLSDPAASARTFASSVFVLTDGFLLFSFTLLPVGLLGLYARLAGTRGARWALMGLLLMMLALGPFQAFTGVGNFAFAAASQSFLQGNTRAMEVIANLITGPSLPLGLLGVILLVLGSIAFALAIWRSTMLPRWAGVLFALGFVLFFPAVGSPSSVQQILRALDGLLIAIGGLWLAYALWSEKRTPMAQRQPGA